MSIRAKMLFASLAGIIATAVVVVAVIAVKKADLEANVSYEIKTQTKVECEKIAHDIAHMLEAAHALTIANLQGNINVVRHLLDCAGDVSVGEENVTWTAVNQFTKTATQVDLPKLLVGETWFGQNTDPKVASPIVDAAQDMVGGTFTVFQRMNAAGDMLRVSTNVIGSDGNRALGTYIPAKNPDGTPNAVVQTLCSGDTFTGRAFVVNAWYNTVYQPLKNKNGEIVGAIYAGIPQQSCNEIRAAIQETVVGKTGYVFAVGATGNERGRYVVSKDGKRDGELIWDAQLADGRYFIREMVEKATDPAKKGAVDFVQYPWQNKGEPAPRDKIAAVIYFEPWDWVIGASMYMDDYEAAIKDVHRQTVSMQRTTIAGAALSILIFGGGTLVAAGRVSKPLKGCVAMLRDIAEGEGDLTRRLQAKGKDEVGQLAKWFNTFMDRLQSLVSDVAQEASKLSTASKGLVDIARQLNEGAEDTSAQASTVSAASEQMSANMGTMAASTERMSNGVRTVSAAIEQMTSSIRDVATNAEKAAQIAEEANRLARDGNDRIASLDEAAEAIGKVIGTIQEIAEQTNLLALNATIEAARAGEAGKGFAVVATEVKELARQSAEATEDIRKRIEGIQSSTQQAVSSLGNIGGVIGQVSDVSQTIASAVGQQSSATNEIASTISEAAHEADAVTAGINETTSAAQEITQSIARVESTARSGLSGARDTASAGEQMAEMAHTLDELVRRFKV